MKSSVRFLLLAVFFNTAFISRAQNICFRANNDFTSANGTNGVVNPKYLAKGDINNDGILDIVTANGNVSGAPSSISIFLGQGNGLFSFQDTVTVTPNSSNTQGIALADFNGDGNLDVVVAKRINASPGPNLMIILGTGTGNFTTTYANISTVGANLLTDLVTGDFDSDGLTDVISLAAANNGAMTFYKNTGTGLLPGVISTPSFTGLGYYIKAAQVDHLVDNHLDVVLTRDGLGRLIFMKNSGTGTFTTGFNILIGSAPRDLDLGDLNGDGNTDVAVAMNGSDSVHIVFTNGSGGISSIARYWSGGDGPRSIVMFDYDGDGDRDIAVTNELDFVLGLLINDGSGNFTLQRHESFFDPAEIVAGNFDSDLKQDLVTTGNSRRLFYMGNNSPNGFLSYNNLFYPTINTQPNSSSMADFNEDGQIDIVTANSAGNAFSLFLGAGGGNFNFASNFSTSSPPLAIQTGDFNGDNNMDVLLVETSGQLLSMYLGDGAGNFGLPTTFGLAGVPTSLSVGDLDNDGDLDAVVTSNAAGAVYVFQNNAGTFALASTLTSGLSGPNNVSINHFNAGANLDLAICNNGNGTVRIYTGNGNCTFTSGNSITVSAGVRMVSSGDYNGDGNKDISVCYGTSTVSYSNGNGSGGFGATVNLTGITGAGAIGWLLSSDLNQDGFDDIVTANNGSADIAVLKGAAGGPSYQQSFFTGFKPTHISQGFVNNDLMPDLAICHADAAGGGSSVAVLLNRTAKITNSGSSSFCAGGSVNLTSTEAYSYQWSTVAQTQSINVSTSNSYTVTTSNYNNSCASISQPEVITVNPAPVITGITGNTTICTSSSTTLTATSNATTPSYVWYDAVTGGNVLSTNAAYTTPVLVANTIYYVAVTDAATGCTSSPRYQVDVVMGDIVAPVIAACPSNIVLNASAGLCSAVATWSAPSATDNCGAATVNQTIGLPSGSAFPVGVHNIQYTAVDGASNSSSCSFTITVVDNQAPTFTTCPSNITQNVAAGTCGAVVSWTTPTASDNCSAAVTQTSGPASGSTLTVGTYTVTYTATDPASNTATCSFTITVVDNINPTITSCPSNQTLGNTPGSCGRVVTWTAPGVTDNCPGATITQTAGPSSGSTFPIGATVVTYTATDGAGNTSTCSFTITINDTEAPVISSCPTNQTLGNTTGSCGRIVTWTAPGVTDNCPGATVTQSAGPASGSLFPIGATTVTYTATDAAGNSSTCSFVITINDTQNPTIVSLPSNISVPASGAGCSATVTWTAPTVSDNCPGATITQSSGLPSGSVFSGSSTVTYTATDAAGNVSTGTFNVTVLDGTPPTFTNCPSNMTVCAGQVVNFSTPTATDDCDSNPLVTQIAGLPSGSVFPSTTTVIFRATDGSGNFTNCTFTVTVNPAPTASLNLGVDQACENGAFVSLTGGTPSGGIYSGTGVSGSSFNPSAAGPGTHTISYTVTNGFGCSAVATDVMTVNAAPSVTFTASPSFICVNAASVAVSGGSPSGGSYSGPGVSGGVFNPNTAGPGVHTITYTVTNSSSCTASATSTIEVGCVGVEETGMDLMRIYPNPSNGMFIIELSGEMQQPVPMMVFNPVGQIVSTDLLLNQESQINLSVLERGVYFIAVEMNGVRYIEKIIIER